MYLDSPVYVLGLFVYFQRSTTETRLEEYDSGLPVFVLFDIYCLGAYKTEDLFCEMTACFRNENICI